MSNERFEWIELANPTPKAPPKPSKAPETVVGKRCPQCGWLDDETKLQCFR